jgi:hypothetical protein
MANLTAQPFINDNEFYSCSEDETDADIIYTIDTCNKRTIFNQPIYDGLTTLHVYATNARSILPLIDNWAFNRKLNEQHVNNIVNDLKSQQTPHLMGTIKTIREPNTMMRIVDGQHRYTAVKRILEEDVNMVWNINLIVEEYTVDDISGDVAINIYKNANKNLNVRVEDLPDIRVMEFVNLLAKKFPSGIIDKNVGGVRRPRITKKDLYNQCQNPAFIDYIVRAHSKDDVVHKVMRFNARLSTMSIKELFGRDNPAKSKLIHYNKAREIGFYLNLDSKFTVLDWLK